MCRVHFIFIAGALVAVFAAAAVRQPTPDTMAIRLNNLGVAYMNQARVNEALASFREALSRDPRLFQARVNEGIALLNGQRLAEAQDVLLDATRRQPESARAWFNLGISYRNLGETDAAVEAFQRVNQIDPSDADTLYFLGQLQLQSGRYEQAIAMFQRCLALDSLHLSAEFGLARAYQLSGDATAAAEHLARFDQLTQSKLGKPISLVYGEQGPYSTAEPAGSAIEAPADFRVRFASGRPDGIRFDPGRQPAQPDRILTLLGAGACFIDFDGDTRFDLLLLAGVRRVNLYRNSGGGRFSDATQRAGFDADSEALGCTVADYGNDGRDDVAIGFGDRVAVYRNQGGGIFRDVTSELGLRADSGGGLPLGLAWVDYDHDGDVDLYISRFLNFPLLPDDQFDFPFGPAAASNQLWRNNGNGTFTDWTAQAGLAGDAPGIAALASDLNNDRAIDFVLTGCRRTAAILTNPREGQFRQSEPWSSSFPAAPAGVVAFDFNKDGWMDLAFTHWGQPGLSVWRNAGGKAFERVTIPEPNWTRGGGIAAVDVDNDGWLDLAAVGERGIAGEMRLLRNLGGERFADVTAAAALSSVRLVRPRALVAADIDGDGDTDLLVTQNGGQPLLFRNNGGSRRTSVRLQDRALPTRDIPVTTRLMETSCRWSVRPTIDLRSWVPGRKWRWSSIPQLCRSFGLAGLGIISSMPMVSPKTWIFTRHTRILSSPCPSTRCLNIPRVPTVPLRILDRSDRGLNGQSEMISARLPAGMYVIQIRSFYALAETNQMVFNLGRYQLSVIAH